MYVNHIHSCDDSRLEYHDHQTGMTPGKKEGERERGREGEGEGEGERERERRERERREERISCEID